MSFMDRIVFGGPDNSLSGCRSEAKAQEATGNARTYLVASCALRAPGQQVVRATKIVS
jgi:hypothetical protein